MLKSSSSRHSMSRTYGPRDMLFLVFPRIGDNMDNLEVDYEDVAVEMFVQTLEGDAQTWYKFLPGASIDGWDAFRRKFTEKWVCK
jgi:hypothetical protein